MVSPLYVTSRWLTGATPGYTTESIDKRYYYGWDFRDNEGTNPSYLGPISDPENALSVGAAFNLENLYEVPSGSLLQFSASISLDNDSLAFRRFTVPFQGGFDGLNPARDIKMGGDIVATNSQGFNLATSTAPGSKAYKKALNAISNQDQFDFNLLVLPGVIYDFHTYVANEALTLCEDRGDAFYIMDTVGLNATLASATAKAGEIDSSYAATYYPWLRVIDTNTNKLIWVPPSVILPEIYAYNDNVAAEWFAPAGLNRGGISSAVGVRVRLPQASRDTLYEGRVNPIAQFPGQGICVWGQKTLQRRASALDRVNVRRLLIAVKKYIASVSRYLVFEQNVEATRNRFLNIVNPYLAGVQERSGLFAFRVVMDETNNTADIIDRNVLYGQIYLQPTRTAEFIILDFNVLPTGASFPTA
jgi:phage tail sheath protein FI